MRFSSCEVVFNLKPTLQRLCRHNKLKFQVLVLSRGGRVGLGLVKSKLKLNSAKAESKASSLGLAELGKSLYSSFKKLRYLIIYFSLLKMNNFEEYNKAKFKV